MGGAKTPGRSRFTTRACALALGLCSLPVRAVPGAELTADPIVRATLAELVRTTHHPWLRWPEFPWYQDEMLGLYGSATDSLVWLRNGRPIELVEDVIEELARADTRGLEPEDYDVGLLRARLATWESDGAPDPADAALFDAALSLLYMRHISDLHIGRVNPKNLGIDLDVEAKKYRLPDVVRRAIAQRRIAAVVAEAEPDLVQYRVMREILAQYVALSRSHSFTPLPAVRKLEPGERYPGLAALAERLRQLGDLERDEDMRAVLERGVYSEEIVTAVRRFQRRHALLDDGIIGKATLAALNVPYERRVTQVKLALERLRWLPDLSARDFLVANVPAFELFAFAADRTGGEPGFRTPIIVGKALDTETPLFLEEMRYLIFRPYWNVPPSITREEILPALREDPTYLDRQDMEIVSGFSSGAGPLPVTAETLEELARGALRVRQRPGPKNALGLVKFIFPNNNHVYLHSTPSPSLFSRQRRDLSHGCIRVQDPVGLAAWVLRDQPEWSRERIEGAMNAEEQERVDLTRPLPVLIFYTTATVSPDGTVGFYEDIYGHDARLEVALLSGEPFEP